MVRTFVHYKLQNIATFIYLANAHTSCLQYIHIIFGSFPTIKIYQLSVNYHSVQLSQLETYQSWPSPRRGQARLQLHPPCRGHAGKQLKCARKMRIKRLNQQQKCGLTNRHIGLTWFNQQKSGVKSEKKLAHSINNGGLTHPKEWGSNNLTTKNGELTSKNLRRCSNNKD